MDKTHGSFWVFRLRRPVDPAADPVGRTEIIAFAWSLALAALLAFLLVAGLVPLLASSQTLIPGIANGVLVPLVVGLLALLGGILTPKSWCDRSWVSGFLVSTRERGGLGKLDLWLLLLGAACLAWSLFRWDDLWATRLIVLVVDVLLLLALLRSPRVDYSQNESRTDLPDWLKPTPPRDGSGRDKASGPGPDPDANCIFEFALNAGAEQQRFGVRVPPELLQELRNINGQLRGRLYFDDPDAVALMDRPPADRREARDIVMSLSRQLLQAAVAAGLTRLQASGMILQFVQVCFAYVRDVESTANFEPYGPYQDYGRFPIETISDRHGDCECTSLLCASLLAYAGYRSALLIVKLVDRETGDLSYHAAVGLAPEGLFVSGAEEGLDLVADPSNTSRRYLYGESTTGGRGAGFGVVPAIWRDGMTVVGVHEFAVVSGGR